jgi:4-diphosphocytidyl-2-C-methyl-D-erythritol kinase
MELLLQRNVYMSGSGSSLFALYSGRDEAEEGCTRLNGKWSGSGKAVFVSRIGQTGI